MVDIKPGLELDRAVAKAIDWRYKIMVGYRCEPIMETIDSDDPRAKKLIPHYSTDLNVAFDAAEQVGLFVEVRHLRKVKSNPWWAGDIVYARAPTPAVAVCAVILKLKEKTQ